MKKNKYTKECDGIIKNLKIEGLDFPPVITVEYEVNGKIYELKENLVFKKTKNTKLGFISVGYKTKSLIELRTGIPATVGNQVKVKYNEENPQNAYLPDNDSKVTWL